VGRSGWYLWRVVRTPLNSGKLYRSAAAVRLILMGRLRAITGTLATVPSPTANPSHTYAAPGLCTATLTVTDNAGLLASVAAAVTISSSGNARLDLLNETGGSGENPLSRNFNWTLPLVSLPGRAAWI
jgi:hypothetical protein